MTTEEIKAREIKAALDLAWKQVHEYARQLHSEGFEVKLVSNLVIEKTNGFTDDVETIATKTTVIMI